MASQKLDLSNTYNRERALRIKPINPRYIRLQLLLSVLMSILFILLLNAYTTQKFYFHQFTYYSLVRLFLAKIYTVFLTNLSYRQPRALAISFNEVTIRICVHSHDRPVVNSKSTLPAFHTALHWKQQQKKRATQQYKTRLIFLYSFPCILHIYSTHRHLLSLKNMPLTLMEYKGSCQLNSEKL